MNAPLQTSEPVQIEVEVATGKWRRHDLSADVLHTEWTRGAAPNKSVVVLADVMRVELVTLGGTTICTLHVKGGAKVSVSSGMSEKPNPAAARSFETFLEALHTRIAAANPQAAFVTGSWSLGGGVLAIVAIGGGALAFLARDPQARELLKFKVGCLLFAVALLVAVPVAFVRGRPKPYDPRRLPRRYDPLSRR